MLEMAQVQCIKNLCDRRDMSYREVARVTGHDPKTVKRWAEEDDFSPHIKVPRSPDKYPVMGPFIAIVDEWLEADMKAPKKQRLTAKRIYVLLVKDHQFEGSERTVREYVRKKKQEIYRVAEVAPGGFIPLVHDPGEAQVDFGEMVYYDETNVLKKGHYLNVGFPYSNAGFAQIFKGENQECLIQGLTNILDYIDGVAPLLVFDNLSAGVVSIKKDGERVLTENFARFVNHYHLNCRFCNPGKGNEKGNVETKVGYHRRNLFVPIPTITDFDAFNRELLDASAIKMAEVHYAKKVLIKDLFEEDKEALLKLPPVPFENYRLMHMTADKYGKVIVDTKQYAVSPTIARNKLMAKVYHDRVEILDSNYQHLITRPRLYGSETEKMDWKAYLPTLMTRPGALFNTSFYKELPEPWQCYFKECDKETRKSALFLLNTIVQNDHLEVGTDALELARLYGSCHPDSISQIYYQLTHETLNQKDILALPENLMSFEYEPVLTSYDQLLMMGGGAHE